jgi:hypothetical protein
MGSDTLGLRKRFWVVPSRILQALTRHFKMVVVGGALPMTVSRGGAGSEQILVDTVFREIVVALDQNGVIAVGNEVAFP